MEKNLQVRVFGKAGCKKCRVLNSRLESLLSKPEWQRFEKVYHDVETEEGMVAFCQTECLNPQRIPAFVITRRDPETGQVRPLPNPQPDDEDEVCGDSRLYQHLGLQTDYTDKGKGLITPKMISSVLYQAVETAD